MVCWACRGVPTEAVLPCYDLSCAHTPRWTALPLATTAPLRAQSLLPWLCALSWRAYPGSATQDVGGCGLRSDRDRAGAPKAGVSLHRAHARAGDLQRHPALRAVW